MHKSLLPFLDHCFPSLKYLSLCNPSLYGYCIFFWGCLIVFICFLQLFYPFRGGVPRKTCRIQAVGTPWVTNWHNDVFPLVFHPSLMILAVLFSFFTAPDPWTNIFKELPIMTPRSFLEAGGVIWSTLIYISRLFSPQMLCFKFHLTLIDCPIIQHCEIILLLLIISFHF